MAVSRPRQLFYLVLVYMYEVELLPTKLSILLCSSRVMTDNSTKTTDDHDHDHDLLKASPSPLPRDDDDENDEYSDSHSHSEYYNVYWVESSGMPRNHVAIFVETHESGLDTGHNFQVSGNIQQGMYHNHRPGKKPEEDEQSAFFSKRVIGKPPKSVYDDGQFRRVCDLVEPPPKQFNGPQRLVPRSKPLRRCGEWAGEAVKRLRSEGILVV